MGSAALAEQFFSPKSASHSDPFGDIRVDEGEAEKEARLKLGLKKKFFSKGRGRKHVTFPFH